MKFDETPQNAEELYDKFIVQRSIGLTFNQFTWVLELFPMLLIVLSDGEIDAEEREYVRRLIKNLANMFAEDGYNEKKAKELERTFNQEFEYLLENIDYWKNDFIYVLRRHLAKQPEQKETILELIYLFAETSKDISDAEKDMIIYLKYELNLDKSS